MRERRIKLKDTILLLPLRDIIVFPQLVMPLGVGRAKSVRALELNDKLIFLCAQKKSNIISDPKETLV